GRAPSRRRDRRGLLALRRRDVERRLHDGLHPLTSGDSGPMRHPLSNGAGAHRLLGVGLVGAAVVIAASFFKTLGGVGGCVPVFAALFWWLRQEPVPGASDPPPAVTSGTPPGHHRVLVVAPPGTEAVTVPEGAELLVVVPALASRGEALTGAVDDRRQDAE